MNITDSSEPDFLSTPYINEFSRHQQEIRAHLTGRVTGTVPLPPTYLPPASYWTSAEKDLFFHGLTIYSRLRPDLIAEHIKTKNIFDVCLFLDCLQTGASQAGPAPETNLDDGETPRNMTEPAMEVSEEWVQYEETMAARLNAFASCPWTLGTEAKKIPCLCPGLRSPAAEDGGHAPLSSHKTGREHLAHLDLGSLMAVERIIKEEETRQDPTQNLFDVVVDAADIQGPEAGLDEHPPSGGNYGPSETPEATLHVNRALENQTEPQDREAHRRLQKRLYMRRKRAEKAGREAILEDIKLRPGRATKRVKKLAKTGIRKSENVETPAPASPVSASASVPDTEALTQPTEQQPVPADGEREAADGDDDGPLKGGLTKSYRVKKKLLENGFDAEALSGMGLDLFHLTTVARMFKLFKSFNDSTEPADTSSVSADTLQLLSAIVTEFASELIRRAIITKEQEIRLKQSLSAWKYDKNEITGENMYECLKSMGLDHLNKSNYFIREASRLKRDSPMSLDPGVEENNDFTLPQAQASLTHPTQFTFPESMMWCSLPSYREMMSTDEAIPDIMDEDLLAAEISEDEMVSLEDKAKSETYEESLWKNLVEI